MPRFRFPLEPILALRRREENARTWELARLETERRRLEDELRKRQVELAEGKGALREELVGALDATLLRQRAAATMAVDRLARSTVMALAGQAQRIARAREILVEAARRRRAVEILRERQLEAWKRDIDRKETAFLDELAVSRAARERGDATSESARPHQEIGS